MKMTSQANNIRVITGSGSLFLIFALLWAIPLSWVIGDWVRQTGRHPADGVPVPRAPGDSVSRTGVGLCRQDRFHMIRALFVLAGWLVPAVSLGQAAPEGYYAQQLCRLRNHPAHGLVRQSARYDYLRHAHGGEKSSKKRSGR